ncbi:hypothetical protein [Bacillus sp. 3G2]|uniref:hypothetical protein n=1 Tax=Bacillus sp. 3G2 TaxID=3375707 RepID=UPI003786F981
MFNKKKHIQIHLWIARILIILLFSISAITLSNGVTSLQKIIKDHYFKEDSQKYLPKETDDFEITEGPVVLTGKEERGYFGTTKSNKKVIIEEKKSLLTPILNLLKNQWIIISFYLICIGIIVFIFYRFLRKKIYKKVILAEKQQNVKSVTIVNNKNEKFSNEPIYQLPTDSVRIKLIEWEQTLPSHEKRRSHESIQQWLYRICRTRDIIPIYESIRYGNNTSTELDLQKTLKWIQENTKTE